MMRTFQKCANCEMVRLMDDGTNAVCDGCRSRGCWRCGRSVREHIYFTVANDMDPNVELVRAQFDDGSDWEGYFCQPHIGSPTDQPDDAHNRQE